MEGFDPRTSFGYEVSKHYDDAVNTRGDEAQTVAFLAGLAGGLHALEFAVGTGRIALPLRAAGVRVDGIELSEHLIERMRAKPGGSDIEVTMGGYVQGQHRAHLRAGVPGVQHDREPARQGRPGPMLRERRPAPGRRRRFCDRVTSRSTSLSLTSAGTVRSRRFWTRTTSRSAPTASSSIRSGCAWRTRRNSTSWPASPAFVCMTDGEGGTANRTPLKLAPHQCLRANLVPEQPKLTCRSKPASFLTQRDEGWICSCFAVTLRYLPRPSGCLDLFAGGADEQVCTIFRRRCGPVAG
jgi:hypothetical protein